MCVCVCLYVYVCVYVCVCLCVCIYFTYKLCRLQSIANKSFNHSSLNKLYAVIGWITAGGTAG